MVVATYINAWQYDNLEPAINRFGTFIKSSNKSRCFIVME